MSLNVLFVLTEHVRVGIPMLRGHQSMPMVHFKAYFVIKWSFFLYIYFG